jgi:putative tryptophan/tyrosine transport system substrate-binding protein
MARDHAVRLGRRRLLQGGLVGTGLALLSGCGFLRALPYQTPEAQRLSLFHVGLDHVPPSLDTLYDELRVLQYEEGRNIHLDWRNLPDEGTAHDVAREFVRDRVHAIVAFENQTVRAAMAATSEIPIVFIHVDDPVANGFVRSHAQPGGNVTGFEGGGLGNLTEKRLDLFKQLVPTLRRLLVLIDPQDPATPRLLLEVRRAAVALEIEVLEDGITEQADVERVFDSHSPSDVDGVFAISPNLQTKFPALLTELATQKRFTMMGFRKEWVEKGALFSCAPDLAPMGRPAARYVDRILKGTKPADLPVQAPDSLELVVNVKTAQTLGLVIPQSALSQATRIIQ